MRQYCRFTGIFTALLLLLLALVPAVSADLEPAFDYEVYRVSPSEWPDTSEYAEYIGEEFIYEVHFTDKSVSDDTLNYWKWEFCTSDWWGSSEQNPVHIYTEEDLKKDGGSYVYVKYAVGDTGGFYNTCEERVYLKEDGFNLKPIHEKKPAAAAETQTPAPTPAVTEVQTAVPTETQTPQQTAAPTPAVTEVQTAVPTETQTPQQTAAPTPQQTAKPKDIKTPTYTMKVPLLSQILGTLQNIYQQYIAIFGF